MTLPTKNFSVFWLLYLKSIKEKKLRIREIIRILYTVFIDCEGVLADLPTVAVVAFCTSAM